MPRANRYYQFGHVYHITHRCHDHQFFLKHRQEKRHYRYWLYQAVKRYGLCVLNYIVTSNHIHLLVQDTGDGVIANSMRLISSRVAQNYNRRKSRHGSFWQGRYFACAINDLNYLMRCIVYIDLNMLRCGVVDHPIQWRFSGYYESIYPRRRYCVIDRNAIQKLLDLPSIVSFNEMREELIIDAIMHNKLERNDMWTRSAMVIHP